MPFLETLAGVSDANQLLQLILQHFQADTGTIHVLEGDGLLHLRAVIGSMPPPVLEAIRALPVGKGIAGQAVEQKKPVNICNIQTDGSGTVRPRARQIGVQGSICVPMMVEGEAVGALGIATYGERTFSEAEIAGLLEAGREIGRKLWNS